MNYTKANVKIKDSNEVCEQVCNASSDYLQWSILVTALGLLKAKLRVFNSSANQQNKKLIKQHKHKGSLK